MNFCSNCGAPATGSAYCGNCGAPMAATAATAGAGRQATPGGAPAPGGGPAAPGDAAPARNPFADIPALDYARDIVALVLLLVSFGMPWDLFDTVTGKVYVILVTLLSVISLSLPYLKRAGVLPASWGTAELRLARLAANAPYVVVVLITLVLGYIGDNNGDGVGVGIAFGLAGALLAAQGRETEQSPSGDGSLWRWITLGIGGLFALLTVVSVVTFLTDAAEGLGWEFVTLIIVTMLLALGLAAVPLWGVYRGDAAWRDVLLLVGVVALFVGVWQLGADLTMEDAWSLSVFGPRLILVPALAVAATAPGLRSHYRQASGAAHWSAVGARMLELAMLVAAAGVVIYVLRIIGFEDGRGTAIVVLVLLLILALAGLVGRNALVRDPNAGRAVAVAVGGVFILLGIVIAAILGASDEVFVLEYDATIISVLWWFGVALFVVLTAPPSVRAEYGPIGASQLSLSSVLPGNGPSTATADRPAPASTGVATGTGVAAGAAAAATGAAATRPAESRTEATPADEAKTEVAARAADAEARAADAEARAADAEVKGDDAKADAAKADAVAADRAAEAAKTDDDVPASPQVPADAHPESLLGEARPGPVSGLAVGGPTADDTETRVDQPAVEPAVDPATRVDQPVVAPGSGFDARTALDPNTSLQTLADIAAQEPGLRKYVAANPSTYPELLTWLSQLGDPEIDEALRRRGGR